MPKHRPRPFEYRVATSHREAKSIGRRPENSPGVTEVARKHAEDRLAQGFSLVQLVAEYRALRASVVRHWIAANPEQDLTQLRELVRFDEGECDALLRVVAAHIDAYRQFQSTHLVRAIGVQTTKTDLPLQKVKQSTELPIKQNWLDRVESSGADPSPIEATPGPSRRARLRLRG